MTIVQIVNHCPTKKMLFAASILFGLLSNALAFDIPNQVHVSLAGKSATGDASTMAVSWNTKASTTTSTVKYGTKSHIYSKSSAGAAAAYYETFNHHVVLDTLIPDTTYYYVVGDDASGWSREFSFHSAPLASQHRGNFSFFVFGDLGVVNGDDSIKYIKDNQDSVDLIWHGGDVSYADDSFLHARCVFKFCYEETFDKYMDEIQPWASKLPYMVTPGNHEADCHDPACLADPVKREKLSNFTAYNGRFHMPSAESGGVLNMHYSFNYGNVHFISLDTETGYPGAAEEKRYVMPCGGFGDQLTWLENDLIQANKERDVRPWVFAAGHHPMYNGDSINGGFQKAMEDLFYKYGVDIYFAGHVHSYERDYPVYKGQVQSNYNNPLATTHLLIGGAGNDEMRNAQQTIFRDPSPLERAGLTAWASSSADGAWTVVTDKDDHVGIGKITIADDSNLKFEYIRTSTGEVFDSFSLFRDHSQYGKKIVN